MSWYYRLDTGEVFEATGLLKWSTDREIGLEKLAGTRIIYGPWGARAEADTFAAAHPSFLSHIQDQARNLQNQVQQAIPDIPGAITAATNTAVKLSIRFAEAAVGIVLLAIAANAILKQATGVDVAGTAVRTGKKAARVAATAAAV